MPQSRRCETFIAAIIAIAATTASVVQAADVRPRCAIIVSQLEPAGNIVADLLAAELTAKGYPVVDRENLSRTLDEQLLAQAFAAGETSTRQKVGRIAGADLLIFLTCRDDEKSIAIEWSVASMPAGLRLLKGSALWNQTQPGESLVTIMASVNQAATLAADESINIVCVSPFICRDATYEQIGKQSTYKKLVEDLLIRIPGVVVVEVDEVESLIRESQLVPDSPKFYAPNFLLGEFMTTNSESKSLTTLAIQMRTAGASLGTKKVTASSDEEMAGALSSALAELLSVTGNERTPMPNSEESEALAAHALTLVRMGERKDALPLLKIASLWAPDNLEIRRLIFATLRGMVSSSAGLPKKYRDPARRVELMEQTLDAFEDMARRRAIGLEDLRALRGFRSNGYLYDTGRVKRESPDVAARYFAFNTRYRRALRDILDGKYGDLDEKMRDKALRMLVSRLSSDSWRSLDPAHDESIELLHNLATAPGDEHHVILMFLKHKPSPDARSVRDKRFWQDCCPSDFERLIELKNIADRMRRLQSQEDGIEFDALLDSSRDPLQLSDRVLGKIRAMAHTRLSESQSESAKNVSTNGSELPNLTEVPGAPTRVMSWVVARPNEVEFVASRSEVYRVTSNHAFEKIHEGGFPRIAWDSQYLWIGTTSELLIVDGAGIIVARIELSGFKELGAFAPGKAMVKSRNTSAEGGWRSAHEIWTLNTNGPPKLTGQLFKVDDHNFNDDINLPDRFARHRSGQPGFAPLISKVSGEAVPDVFSLSRACGLYLNPYEYRKSTSHNWPPMADCVEFDGSYYLLPAYSTIKGYARRHAVFKVDTPDSAPQMVTDLGWQRYHGNFAHVVWSTGSSINSSVVQGEWLHFLRDYQDCPPQWGAVNLVTGEARAIVVDVGRDLKVDARQFVKSTLFELLLVANMQVYQVELPPSDTWLPYDEAVAGLRFQEDQRPMDDLKLWQAK
ncbi:MAG: hypothetical protein DHS20C16_12750 [Phycisphaerae bacterium]|nr:MAG: hypothetical protein DHS20C16_12750 [Phycisphaerae bacterium]